LLEVVQRESVWAAVGTGVTGIRDVRKLDESDATARQVSPRVVVGRVFVDVADHLIAGPEWIATGDEGKTFGRVALKGDIGSTGAEQSGHGAVEPVDRFVIRAEHQPTGFGLAVSRRDHALQCDCGQQRSAARHQKDLAIPSWECRALLSNVAISRGGA
jgi:hypothetical protein